MFPTNRPRTSYGAMQRHLTLQEASDKYEHLDVLADSDANTFWSSLKKLRTQGTPSTGCTKMKFGATMVRDPKGISDGWADYFQKLYAPLESADFDSEHREAVSNSYQQYLIDSSNNCCEDLDGVVLESEVHAACKTVKLGKACGPDNVAPEHVKYGGAALWAHLTRLFNLIHCNEYMPAELKVGKIITLLKDKKKQVYDPNNYRGITLLSTVYKLFEKVILVRFISWTKTQQCGLSRLLSVCLPEETLLC